MNYTKGDWYVKTNQYAGDAEVLTDTERVCIVRDGNIDDNARLIAAAPDLYEALKIAVSFIPNKAAARSMAMRAISKAEVK